MRLLRNRLGSESGFVLIEAITSATIALIVLYGLYAVVDSSNVASGKAKVGSIAGGIAEADQEQLRSMRPVQLSNYHATRTVTDSGASYTVSSRADWIRDETGGAQSCTSASSQADYLRITSSVTPTGSTAPPTELRSIVAAPVGAFGPGQGTLAIRVADRTGTPIQGVTVAITGPTALSDVTNAQGCAIFGYIPVGSYTAKVNATGYVDRSGTTPPTASASVTEGVVNLVSIDADRAATVSTSFDTQAAGGSVAAATSYGITVAHSQMPGSGSKVVTSASAVSSLASGNLFPFTTPYTIWSGTCAAGNPALYDGNYFVTHNGDVTLSPATSTTVTVREPALNLTVTTPAASTPVRIVATSSDAGCSESFSWNVTTGATRTAKPSEPGLPFGHYRLCASTSAGRVTYPSIVNNIVDTGTPVIAMDLSAPVAGTC